jgi:hypothetical protein
MNALWPAPASSRAWPPAAVPWQVAFELDLTRLRAQTLTGSTASFGGLDWTLGNASSAATFDLSPGAGLRIAPNDGTLLDGSNTSAPWVAVKLADLAPQRVRADRLLVQAMVGQPGLAGGSQAFALLCASGTTAVNRVSAAAMVLHDGALKARAGRFHGSGLDGYAETIAAEPRQLAVEWAPVMGRAFRSEASAWARPGALTPIANAGNVEALDPGSSEGAIVAASDLLRFAAWRPSGASAFTAELRALRVLWSPR